MGFIGQEIGHFFVGLMFLTRLPAPGGLHHSEGRLARAARYFPLVGVLIGLISGVIFIVADAALSSAIAAGLALTAGLFVTGALHEDGMADTCDGIGGGTDPDKSLEIMRDSRLGTYGGAGLFMSLGLRWLALAQFAGVDGMIALVVAHAVSRAMLPPVLMSGRYARTRGLASSVAGGVRGGEALVAAILALIVAMIAGPVAGLLAIAVAVVAAGVTLVLIMRKLGGYTGDTLGAIQQVPRSRS